MSGSSPPSEGPREASERSRRIVFLGATGLLAVAVLYAFREVLAPFTLALVVAYVFAPIVDWLQARRVAGRRIPRSLAVVVLYVSLLGTLGGAIAVGAPLIASEFGRLGRETPRMLRTARHEWLPALDHAVRSFSAAVAIDPHEGAPSDEDDAASPDALDERAGRDPEGPSEGLDEVAPGHVALRPTAEGGFDLVLPREGLSIRPITGGGYVLRAEEDHEPESLDLSAQITEALRRQMREGEQSAGAALRTAQSLVAALVNGIFKFFIMLMISAYILATKDGILGFFRTLVAPAQRAGFDLLLDRIDKGLAGVVRGQLLICLINGVLSGVGFYLADLEYWPVLTLIATVLSIIPIFGAILSSVPAVLVGLQQGLGVALFTLAWIIGIHQIEANILNPKIMGDAAKVHPVLVVFSLIAGEHFFGILGALLAVPVLSIAQSLFLHFREIVLGVPVTASISGLSSSSEGSGPRRAPADAPPSEARSPAATPDEPSP